MLFCKGAFTDEVDSQDRFEGKEDEAKIAQYRHLKDLELLKEGYRVNPFRDSPIVPCLPQQSADKA